jgi:four helix bundle protein
LGNVLKEKSYKFALRIVKLSQYLRSNNEFELSRQVVRSGTSIGALVREAEFAQSKADFIHKLSIALKETNETEYCLELLKDGGYISPQMYSGIYPDIEELIKLLVSSVKTSKERLQIQS